MAKKQSPLIRWLIKHRVGLALALVLLLAAVFRLWQLDSLPPGLHPDEAANGLDIFRILNGDLRVLYNTNGPREALFFYLQTPFVWALDNSILALRLAPALVGIGAVWLTYLWLRSWFSQREALLSALFFASGSWAVTLARDGFRANLVPFFIALNGFLITKVIQTKKWYWAVASGLSLGAGLYSYFSYRFLGVAILATLGFSFIKYRDQFKSLLKPILIIILSGAIILVPLGFYGLDHPDEVVTGRSSVTFTNPELNNGQPWQTLGETILKTALMFNVEGDPNFRHNLGGAPMFNAVVGVFFLLGLLISLRRIKDIRYFSLLMVFGAMLIPEVVTAEGIPHGLRAIGVLPVVYIFAAVGLNELIGRWQTVFPRNLAAKSFLIAIVGLVLVTSLVYDWRRYFVVWANAPETYEAYSEDAVAIASYLNQNPFIGNRYVVSGEYTNKTIEYLTHNKSSYQRLEPDQVDEINVQKPLQILVIATSHHPTEQELTKLNVNLRVSEIKSPARIHVVLFRIYELANE